MRKLLSLLAACLLLCSSAHAQVGFGGMLPGPGTPHSSGGGAYAGPGDVSAATGYWGLRAVDAAKATAAVAAIQICTAADALCTDIHVTSTGGLSASDITTSTCTTTCTIKIFYDQTAGGADFTQSTIANRAVFHPSCISSLPCADFDGVNDSYQFFTYNAVQPFTLSAAVNATNNSGLHQIMGEYNGQSWLYIEDSTTQWGSYAGSAVTIVSGFTFSTWHALTGTFDGASSYLSTDGTQSSVSPGTAGLQYMELSGQTAGSSRLFAGKAFEFIFWTSALSPTNLTNLSNNQHSYGLY